MRASEAIGNGPGSISRSSVGALLAAFLIAHAAPAEAETLPDAIAAAYAANPDILAAQARLRALDERYLQARASQGPTVDATVSAQTQHALVDDPLVRGSRFTAQTTAETVSITQPLYSGGRGYAAAQAALASIFVGYQDVRRAEGRILGQVADAYVDVLRDQQTVAIGEETVRLLEGQVGETRAKLAAREATLTDRDQGFARLAAAQAQLVLAHGRLAADRDAYRAVVGHDPGTLAPAPVLPDLATDLDEYVRLAEQSSPVLLGAEFQERSSRAGIAAARGLARPSVALRGDVNQGPLIAYDDRLRDDNQTVRVTLNVPLFSSGQGLSRIREARALNQADGDLYESARRQVRANVAQAWEQMQASQAAEVLYERQIEAQAGVYKGTRLEERYALRSTLDILNAAQELDNARLQRANAAHDAYQGKTALLVAAGRLDPGTFGIATRPDRLAPDIRALDRRDRVPWIRLIEALDGIGQERVLR